MSLQTSRCASELLQTIIDDIQTQDAEVEP